MRSPGALKQQEWLEKLGLARDRRREYANNDEGILLGMS